MGKKWLSYPSPRIRYTSDTKISVSFTIHENGIYMCCLTMWYRKHFYCIALVFLQACGQQFASLFGVRCVPWPIKWSEERTRGMTTWRRGGGALVSVSAVAGGEILWIQQGIRLMASNPYRQWQLEEMCRIQMDIREPKLYWPWQLAYTGHGSWKGIGIHTGARGLKWVFFFKFFFFYNCQNISHN